MRTLMSERGRVSLRGRTEKKHSRDVGVLIGTGKHNSEREKKCVTRDIVSSNHLSARNAHRSKQARIEKNISMSLTQGVITKIQWGNQGNGDRRIEGGWETHAAGTSDG